MIYRSLVPVDLKVNASLLENVCCHVDNGSMKKPAKKTGEQSDEAKAASLKMRHAVNARIRTKLDELFESRQKNQTWLRTTICSMVGVDDYVSKNAVSKWASTGQVSLENLVLIAQAFDISLDELVRYDYKQKEEPAKITHGVAEPAPIYSVQATGQMQLTYVAPDEQTLLTNYRQSTETGRDMIQIQAKGVPKDQRMLDMERKTVLLLGNGIKTVE
jgi:transcriptional regulator with XRE-family HTH domain